MTEKRDNGRPSCDTLIELGDIERPDKYCRIGGCEVAENDGPECHCMKAYMEAQK